MVRGFVAGSANIGPAAKATARALGIKPTIKSIKEFLNEPNPDFVNNRGE
jgi:hypothetical protein